MTPWSVIAAAVIPSSLTLATYSLILFEPSRRLYSVWTCKCAKFILCSLLFSVFHFSRNEGDFQLVGEKFYRLVGGGFSNICTPVPLGKTFRRTPESGNRVNFLFGALVSQPYLSSNAKIPPHQISFPMRRYSSFIIASNQYALLLSG